MEHEQVRRRGEDPLLWLIVHLLVGLLLSAIAATLAFYCFAVGYPKAMIYFGGTYGGYLVLVYILIPLAEVFGLRELLHMRLTHRHEKTIKRQDLALAKKQLSQEKQLAELADSTKRLEIGVNMYHAVTERQGLDIEALKVQTQQIANQQQHTIALLSQQMAERAQAQQERWMEHQIERNHNLIYPDANGVMPLIRNQPGMQQDAFWQPQTVHRFNRTPKVEVTEVPNEVQALPDVPPARELLLNGRIEAEIAEGYYLLGPSDDGKWKRISCKRLFSTIIAGIPRVGKTTTVFWIVVQVLIRLGRFFVIDPNMDYVSEDGDRGLASELAELARFMVFPACVGTRKDLRERILYMYHELKRRKQPGYVVKNSDTVLCIMDEFNTLASIMDTKEIVVTDDEAGELTLLGVLALLEREGPKYGLVFMLIGHKWTRQDIGDNAIRTNATTYLCHKMNDEGQAKLLMSSHAKRVLELPVGAYLASGPQFEENATKIYTPMISARDIPIILSVIARVAQASEHATNQPGQSVDVINEAVYAPPRPRHVHERSGARPISSTEEDNGRDTNQPGQRVDASNEEILLSDDLRVKMQLVLQMDQQRGTSVNEIIRQVWGIDDPSSRQGRAAKEQLSEIRAYIARQVSNILR